MKQKKKRTRLPVLMLIAWVYIYGVIGGMECGTLSLVGGIIRSAAVIVVLLAACCVRKRKKPAVRAAGKRQGA